MFNYSQLERDGGKAFSGLINKMFNFVGREGKFPDSFESFEILNSSSASTKLYESEVEALEYKGGLMKTINNVGENENWMLLRTFNRDDSYDLSLIFLNHWALRRKEGENRDVGFNFVKENVKGFMIHRVPCFPGGTYFLSLRPEEKKSKQLIIPSDENVCLPLYKLQEIIIEPNILKDKGIADLHWKNRIKLSYLMSLDTSKFVDCHRIVDRRIAYREVEIKS